MNTLSRKGIIYKAVSPSGKVYIGQTTCSLSNRIGKHISSAFIKTKDGLYKYNYKISRAIRKYGDKIKWEILLDNIDISLLNQKEDYYIKLYNSINNGYNIDSSRGRINKRSDETKAKISRSRKGHITTSETREKISKALKGHITTDETKEKMRLKRIGYKHTEESKKKISLNNARYNLGKKYSLNMRKKLSISHGGKLFGIYNLNNELLNQFINQAECADKYGLSQSKISLCLIGKRKKHKNFIFKYMEHT